MKLAVIKTGGKQYKVAEKDKLKIEKIEGKVGDKITFDEVFLAVDGNKVEIGAPTVAVKVEAKILEQARDKKVDVVHYKAKTRHYSRRGHRQLFTKVEITKIA